MVFETSKRRDWLYVGFALLMLVGLFFSNRYFSEVSRLWRLLGALVAFAMVFVLLFKTRWGQSLWARSQDVQQELSRMHWPTRQETLQTTIATLAMVLVMGLLLWTADFALLRAVKWLTGHWGV